MHSFLKFVTLAGVLSITACGHKPAGQQPAVPATQSNTVAANALAKQIKEAGILVTQQGEMLDVEGHQIGVATTVDQETEREGKTFVGLAVQVKLDGKELPAMHSGTVGIDSTKDAAITNAADDWTKQFGMLLVHALGPQPSTVKSVAAGAYTVFSGSVGMRGSDDYKLFKDAHDKIDRIIAQFVMKRFPNAAEWHGMNVMVVNDPKRGVVSVCQMDGSATPDAELSAAAKSAPWPKGQVSYMYKQFFLAKPNK